MHNNKRLTIILFKIIRAYGLKDRIYAITSDNAGNMGTLFKELVQVYKKRNKRVKIITDSLPINERDNISTVVDSEHIPCLAHIIQLSLGQLMRAIKISPTNK